MENGFVLKAEGYNEGNANSKLPALDYELRNIGAKMGKDYVTHISPNITTISRWYFGKENEDLKKAKLFINANNWEAAKDIWLTQSNSTDNKTAGRAFNNLAVYYESKKDINKAYELAQKANQLYKNKYTGAYIKQLQFEYQLN